MTTSGKPLALKLIKRGMDTDEVVRRFRQERSILSRLDHPNIARLLDGGTTDDGRPYFVMEYVEGEPIAGYALKLPLRERLTLFRQVCDAVEYAHRNLVVHRDLKPSNILVTAEGAPKLLDFGIAKLLTPDDTSQTVTSLRILTPDYASPEQMRGDPVTTARDVYSLGRVLEKLLGEETGAGELPQIVQMARHEEPERRYPSVAQLSDDIRRYLEGMPVHARGDTVVYRTRKFVRRNKWSVAAAVFAWLSLATGMGLAWHQARRAEERFERLRSFASTMIADVGRKLRNAVGNLEARQSLARNALQVFDELGKSAPANSKLQLDLAKAYLLVSEFQYDLTHASGNQFEESLTSVNKARALVEALVSQKAGGIDARCLQAAVYQQIGVIVDGEDKQAEALEWFRRYDAIAREVGHVWRKPLNRRTSLPVAEFEILAFI